MEPLSNLGGVRPAAPGPARPAHPAAGQPNFGQVFGAEVARQARAEFSNHAQVRFEQRGLNLDGPALQRLGSALDRASQKGVRTSVIMLDGMAMVANVPERRIITALNQAQAKEKIFTNIDGVVFA